MRGVSGSGGVSKKMGEGPKPPPSVQEIGQRVWRLLQSDGGQREVESLLKTLPAGVLDLSQQDALSEQATDRLFWALQGLWNHQPPCVPILKLGKVDDVRALCGHPWSRYVQTLDLSGLRVRVGERYVVPSIQQVKRLQAAFRESHTRGHPLHKVVIASQTCPSAQEKGWQDLSSELGVQLEFAPSDLSAQEVQTLVRDAWEELLCGGFTAEEVDALLADPRFKDMRELNVADMLQQGRPWRGLPLVLASQACPVRTLVLPPPCETILHLFGLHVSERKAYLDRIFGPVDKGPRRYPALDVVELRDWSPRQVDKQASALALRPVGLYLVVPEMGDSDDVDTLVACGAQLPNLRVKDLARFNEAGAFKYQQQCWDRLLKRKVAGSPDQLFQWPEFRTSYLELGFGAGHCGREVWRELAKLLRHPDCPLSALRFANVEVLASSGGRAEFLRTFIDSGLRTLDLRTWTVKDGRIPGAIRLQWAGFGEGDVRTLDGFDVPACVPVIVLHVDQITALQPQLEELSRKGWVFEDEDGNRVPKAPEPIDKRRLWMQLDLGHDDELRQMLFDAKRSPKRFAEIRAFAQTLSHLDTSSQREGMQESQFAVAAHFVAQAVERDSEQTLRGALTRSSDFSLQQCRQLLEPCSAQRENAFQAISPPQAYEERVKAIRAALSGSWDPDAIRQGFTDDPTLSPLYRVWINGWARRTVERGQHLLKLLEAVEHSAAQE